MPLTGHRQSPTADPYARTSVSAGVAPFEQARSRAASHGFLKVLGLYLVAGLMLGVLPASFPLALILSAVVVDNSTRIRGMPHFNARAVLRRGTAVAYIALGLAAESNERISESLLGRPPPGRVPIFRGTRA
jgi:thiol:disulfide interchange protein